MNNNNVFSERLTYFRREKGMLQKDLAEALGVGDATVSGWERGAFTPKLEILYKICDVFSISIADLLDSNTQAACILTVEEDAVVDAYRQRPEMHNAVKTLLGIK